MVKPIIYLGPSLSHEKAKKILDADYRSPAKKGDLLNLLTIESSEKIKIGLVDAVFLQDYPPPPIEVYQLVSRPDRFQVFGASSLGALRAVELEKYGMVGIGKIFGFYKRKILDADDEVAVTFDQYQNNLISEALIDIRYNLFLACKFEIIDKTVKKKMLKIAKKTYFPYRTYENIISQTLERYPHFLGQINLFKTFIASNRKSLKERDAIELLYHLKMIIKNNCK